MKNTGESLIAEMGWDWWNTETSARRVAEFAAKKLNNNEAEEMYTRQQLEDAWDAGYNRGLFVADTSGEYTSPFSVDEPRDKNKWVEENLR